MLTFSYNNSQEAFEQVAYWIWDKGTQIVIRDKIVKEIRNAIIEIICPTDGCLKFNDEKIDKKVQAYYNAEIELYNNCETYASEFAKASKFWEKLANPDGTINSAYGHLIWEAKLPGRITPWEWCKKKLKEDKHTRQAVLLFLRPTHFVDCPDFVCTCHGQFFIRKNRLEFDIVMRSNDLMRGSLYDWPWFMSLQKKMADQLNIGIGSYTHFAHSLHIYHDESSQQKMLALKNIRGQ
jgi:thymidylate synthase